MATPNNWAYYPAKMLRASAIGKLVDELKAQTGKLPLLQQSASDLAKLIASWRALHEKTSGLCDAETRHAFDAVTGALLWAQDQLDGQIQMEAA